MRIFRQKRCRNRLIVESTKQSEGGCFHDSRRAFAVRYQFESERYRLARSLISPSRSSVATRSGSRVVLILGDGAVPAPVPWGFSAWPPDESSSFRRRCRWPDRPAIEPARRNSSPPHARIASSSAVKSGPRRSAPGAEASSLAQAESPFALFRAAKRRTKRERMTDRHISDRQDSGVVKRVSVSSTSAVACARQPTRATEEDVDHSRPVRERAECRQCPARRRAEADGQCSRAEHKPRCRSREQPGQ